MVGALGKPDHHTFIMLFILLFIDAAVLTIRYRFSRTKDYVRMALISALCIWISPETLIPIVLVDVLMFFLTFFKIGNLKMLFLKNIIIAFFIGIIIMDAVRSNLGVFFALMILLLMSMIYLIENDVVFSKSMYLSSLVSFASVGIPILLLVFIPFTSGIGAVEYDKISVVHFALYLSASVFLGLCLFGLRRVKISGFLLGGIIFFIVAAIFLLTYPKFFSGMEADISDYTKKIWLSKVSEMKSPFSSRLAGYFTMHLLCVIVMVTYKVCQLGIAHKRVLVAQCFRNRVSLVWWIFLLNAICYTIFAALANRMLPYSILFSLPLYVDFCMNRIPGRLFGDGVRLAAAFFSTIGLFIAFIFVDVGQDSPRPSSDKSKYTPQELWETIDRLSDTTVVIMTHSSYGPKLLYYTKHSVVAAPYHRQPEGIASFHKAMMDGFNESIVRKILIDTNTSYILLKKNIFSQDQFCNDSFQNLSCMIINGNLPKWGNIVEISEKFNDIIIVKIDKELLRADGLNK
jgi:hypothetical protein